MTTWRHIKGSEEDFEGAPEWATMKCYCSLSNEPNSDYAWCEGIFKGAVWKDLESYLQLEKMDKPEQWFAVAQRERVTSINDDRLLASLNDLPLVSEKYPRQDVNALIAERGSRYGKFADGAEIMCDLKHVMHEVDRWNDLTASQKEALDMIQHKIGRILNGDPTYDDNWKDIAGYATLIADELNGVVK